jgi:hypothetical protein
MGVRETTADNGNRPLQAHWILGMARTEADVTAASRFMRPSRHAIYPRTSGANYLDGHESGRFARDAGN